MIDTQLELFPDLDKELYIQQLEKKVRELTSENIRYAGVLYGFAFGNYDERVKKRAEEAIKDRKRIGELQWKSQ
jgi:hypothetical protein